MPSKHHLIQLKYVKAVVVLSSKKRKVEVSLVFNLAQLKIDDDKLNTTDISDIKGKSGTWFWNENPNESDSDIKKERNKGKKEGENNKSNPKIEKFSTKRIVSPEVEIK